MGEFRLTQKFIEDHWSDFERATVKPLQLTGKATPQKVANMIKTTGAPVTAADVVAVIDTSLFGNGKKGILLTQTMIYGKEKECVGVDLTDIDDLRFIRGKLTVSYPGGKTVCVSGEELPYLFLAILDVIQRIHRDQAWKEEKEAKRAAEEAKKFPRPIPLEDSHVQIPDNHYLRSIQAQDVFEKALLLCLNREKSLDGRSLGAWVDAAVKLGHPRAQYLVWLLDGTLPGHMVEAGPLFRALQALWDNDQDKAFQAFEQVEALGDMDGMLCYAWCLCELKGTWEAFMQVEYLLRRTKDSYDESAFRAVVVTKRKEKPEVYNTFVRNYNRMVDNLNLARETNEKRGPLFASEYFKIAYGLAPWPNIGYEYALCAQYAEEVGGLDTMVASAKTGYVPAVLSLADYYNQGDGGYREINRSRYLKSLERVAPQRAEPLATKFRYREGALLFAVRWMPNMDRGTRIYNIPDSPEERKTWIQKIWAGDRVCFGKENWIVLERQEDRLLLLADMVDGRCTFHDGDGNVTWADCDLRARLNKDWIKRQLTKKEQEMLVTVTNKNPRLDGKPDDPDTRDKVFLLSVEEARRYFGVRDYYTANEDPGYVDDLGRANPTDSLAQNELEVGVAMCLDTMTREYNWALRTPGTDAGRCAEICRGRIHLPGSGLSGLRPAMWIRVN